MKLSKKILTIFFILTIISAFAVVASAVTLTIDTVEVELGEETAIVPLRISDNSGLSGFAIKLLFDENLTLKKAVQVKEGLAECDFATSKGDLSKLSWEYADDDTSEGQIANLTFEIPNVAGEYEITADVTDSYDFWLDDVDATVVSGKIIVKGAEAPAATLTAKGTSLYLDGTVGIKAYFEYTGAETLMINGEAAVAEGNNLYYAYLKSVPKNYKNEVTFTATASDVEAAKITTSVANAIDEYQAGNYDDKTKALADALEVYCNNAEAFFGTGATITVASAGLTAPAFEGEKTINGVTFNSTSLILEDTITLRHYFKVADGASATGFTGTTEDGFAYVEFTNINATALGTDIPVTVAGFNFSFAPVDYIALTQNSADAKLANLVNALYNYYLAAVKY